MRRFFLSIPLFFGFLFSSGQNLESNIRWVKVLSAYGVGLNGMYPLSATDKDGNFVMLTYLEGELKIDHSHISNAPQLSYSSILKFDSLGNLIFYKHMSNSGYPFGLAIDGANNIFVSYLSLSSGQTKILSKVSPTGNIIWKDSLQHQMLTSSFYYNELAADSIGNLFLGSSNNQPGSVYFNSDSLFGDSTGLSFFILKIDPNGGLAQNRFFVDNSNQWSFSYCYLSAIAFNRYSGQLVIIGNSELGHLEVGSAPHDTVGPGSFVVKYNTNLDVIDKSEFPGGQTFGHCLNFDKNNNGYVSFNFQNWMIIDGDTLDANGGTGGAIVKLDPDLNHNWYRFIDNNEGNTSIITSSVRPSGSIYFTIDDDDSLASKLGPDGNFRWNFFLAGAPINYVYRIITCGRENQLYGTIGFNAPVVINGITYVPDSFSVLLYNMNDPDSLVAIEEYEKLNLSVFPNPSNTEIKILSPESMVESIEIYNLLGDRIDFMEIGGFNKTIDTRNYIPGFYFLSIQTIHGIAIRKVMIQ